MSNPGYQTRLLVGKYDLSGYVTSVTVDRTRNTPEVTVFQPGTSTPHRDYIAGRADSTVAIDGLFDPETGASDEIINEITDGTEQIITISPQGAVAVGDRAVLVSGFQDSAPLSVSGDDAVKFTSGRKGSGAARGGVVLHDHVAETTTGNQSSVDNAASSAYGAVAHLHVTAFDGTNAVVKVTDSTDNSTFADLVTFTTVTAATSERKSVTGTVNRYVRVELSGTFTSITFTVGFARHNQ